MAEKIDWDGMGISSFVKLEEGVPKKLHLCNWRKQTAFKDNEGNVKPGLVFDVLEEDNATCVKTWTVTAMKAIFKLKPIIELAEQQNRETLTVNVIKVGQGKETVYTIKEI